MQVTSSHHRALHPLLYEREVPTSEVRMVFISRYEDLYKEGHFPSSCAVRAIHNRDMKMLQVIHNLQLHTPELRNGKPFISRSDSSIDPLSFKYAQATATRLGEKTILQWLLTSAGIPVEPTLLSEAVYFQQFEIAEWLAEKFPEACQELNWSDKGDEDGFIDCGLDSGVLDWLESCEAVRNVVPFAGIIDFAARANDVASLERLYEWHPELFTPRPALVELADLWQCSGTINFLLEIGWEADVFL